MTVEACRNQRFHFLCRTRKTPAILRLRHESGYSRLVMFVSPELAKGNIITGTSDLLNGHPVTAFADVDASNQLSAVGLQVTGAAVRDPGAA